MLIVGCHDTHVKLIRYQFWCNRCAFQLLKSLQWCWGRRSWKSEKKNMWKLKEPSDENQTECHEPNPSKESYACLIFSESTFDTVFWQCISAQLCRTRIFVRLLSRNFSNTAFSALPWSSVVFPNTIMSEIFLHLETPCKTCWIILWYISGGRWNSRHKALVSV
jgi:hypothetical protein